VKASYEVRKPASLLNQERLIELDAIEFTVPPVPRYAKPCERDESRRAELNVELAVENNPPPKPMAVEVELYPATEVNGNTCPASVEVETVLSAPEEPTYEYPCASEPRLSVPIYAAVADAYANEPRVVEEFVKVWSAVHVFGLAKFKAIVAFEPPSWKPSAPEETVREEPTARVEVEVVLSVPLDPAV
jgi:hypothetical protein